MMEDFLAYKGLFIERGILLATSNNGEIDLFTPSGVLTATIKTAVSEHEIAMMRTRMKRVARQKAEQGVPKWTTAFGYLDHQPDPATAPLVRAAYKAVVRGETITAIAKRWNAKGVHGISGKPWSASTLSLFLRAPRYAGLRSHNGEIVGPGNWPGLVPEELWRAAQTVMNAPGRAPESVRKHLLTGVMRCGKPGCGGHLAGNWVMQSTGGPRAHQITYACKKCRGVSKRRAAGDRRADHPAGTTGRRQALCARRWSTPARPRGSGPRRRCCWRGWTPSPTNAPMVISLDGRRRARPHASRRSLTR